MHKPVERRRSNVEDQGSNLERRRSKVRRQRSTVKGRKSKVGGFVLGSVTVSAGRLFAPEGRWIVATGGVRRSRTQPVVSWLQSSVPPGPFFRRRFCHAPLVLLLCVVSAGSARGQVGATDDDYELLRATQKVFRSVLAEIRPSLVRIETVGGSQPGDKGTFQSNAGEGEPKPRSQSPFRDSPGGRFSVADGSTTGIVYSADGFIVTSSFNFVREPVLISVTLADGRRLAADLIARDQVRKVALLRVDATDLSVPRWRSMKEVHVGEWAIALGLGFGSDDPSIAVGIVSALHRMRANAFQTDAKLSPANYGGPVCDLAGRVVGLAVPMAQRPGELAGVEMYDSGVGFAIPKNRLDEIVAILKTGRSFYRGWLGISIDPHVPDGLVIQNIAEPSPMHETGVLPGDRILAIDGRPIRHFGHLVQALYMVPAGQSVHLTLQREGADFEATVTLARSDELGPLPNLPEPFDPAEPFPAPSDED